MLLNKEPDRTVSHSLLDVIPKTKYNMCDSGSPDRGNSSILLVMFKYLSTLLSLIKETDLLIWKGCRKKVNSPGKKRVSVHLGVQTSLKYLLICICLFNFHLKNVKWPCLSVVCIRESLL